MASPSDPLNPYAPPRAAVLEASSGEAGELILEGRKVAPSRGKAWFGEAWELFKRAPGIWILNFILFMVMTLVLAIIPLGSLVSYLLYPVFMAGLMLGCRDLEGGLPLEVAHLFAGFKQNTGNLILVGLLYMVGLIIVTIVAFVPVGILAGFMFAAAGTAASADPSLFAWLIGLGVAFVFTLALPLLMALWFAPALVVFHDVQPMAALKASFAGCLKNLVPFLVYGLIGLLLLIVALIPVGLGLLVVIPLLWVTTYTGYRDIFIRQD